MTSRYAVVVVNPEDLKIAHESHQSVFALTRSRQRDLPAPGIPPQRLTPDVGTRIQQALPATAGVAAEPNLLSRWPCGRWWPLTLGANTNAADVQAALDIARRREHRVYGVAPQDPGIPGGVARQLRRRRIGPPATSARIRSKSRHGHRERVLPPRCHRGTRLTRPPYRKPSRSSKPWKATAAERPCLDARRRRPLPQHVAGRPGDVEAAERMARQAMVEHDRIPMRFERARTQLLLGQLQRRQRQKDTATETLKQALAAFEDIGTPLWADRARAELARTEVAPAPRLCSPPLSDGWPNLRHRARPTGTSQRPCSSARKPSRANLGRIYRKLGINSRSELGRLIGDLITPSGITPRRSYE